MGIDIIEGAKSSAKIVSEAGGRIVGRTKIQKIAYILEIANQGSGFAFEYKHYGPYSEDLSSSLKIAGILEFIDEQVSSTNWGGYYSTYTTKDASCVAGDSLREKLISLGNSSNSVELELVATAAFLANQGEVDPWNETALRKPDKVSGGRLERAKALYTKFNSLDAAKPVLPVLN